MISLNKYHRWSDRPCRLLDIQARGDVPYLHNIHTEYWKHHGSQDSSHGTLKFSRSLTSALRAYFVVELSTATNMIDLSNQEAY